MKPYIIITLAIIIIIFYFYFYSYSHSYSHSHPKKGDESRPSPSSSKSGIKLRDSSRTIISGNQTFIPYSIDNSITQQQLYIIKEYINNKLFSAPIKLGYSLDNTYTINSALGMYAGIGGIVDNVKFTVTNLTSTGAGFTPDNKEFLFYFTIGLDCIVSIPEFKVSFTYGLTGGNSVTISSDIKLTINPLPFLCTVDCSTNKASFKNLSDAIDINSDISFVDNLISSISIIGQGGNIKNAIYTMLDNFIDSKIPYVNLIQNTIPSSIELPIIYPIPPLSVCATDKEYPQLGNHCVQVVNEGNVNIDNVKAFNTIAECNQIGVCETSNLVNCSIRKANIIGFSSTGLITPSQTITIDKNYDWQNCSGICSRLPCDNCAYWNVQRIDDVNSKCNIYNSGNLLFIDDWYGKSVSGKRRCGDLDKCN